MSEDLIKQLEHTREGYDDEVAWHRFLIDAYTGGGGFQGSIKQPAHDYWGSAATLYATGGTIARQDETRVNSYLDRYPREDSDKYRSRVGASHYTNYVAPLTDLKCGYIRKRPHTIRERPEALQEWHLDTDGNRTRASDGARRSSTFPKRPSMTRAPRSSSRRHRPASSAVVRS
jgi:hypothetical protein